MDLSQSLPPSVIDVSFKFPTDQGWDAVLQPDVTQERVVPFLVEEQLAAAPEPRIDLAVLVEIRGLRPGAVFAVEEQDRAFTNVDKEADIGVASAWRGCVSVEKGDRSKFGGGPKRIGLTFSCAGCNRLCRPYGSMWLGCRKFRHKRDIDLDRLNPFRLLDIDVSLSHK